MSSRALRKLYGNSHDQFSLKDEETKVTDDEEGTDEKEDVELTCVNKFLLLEEGQDDIKSSDSETEETKSSNITTSKPPSKTRKKKKKRKKKNSVNLDKNNCCDDYNDVDRVIEELNEQVDKTTGEQSNKHLQKVKTKKSVLDVEHRFLNIYNELQKIFGSQVLKKDAEYRRRHKGMSSHKGVWLTQPSENWVKMIKVGLSMELLETDKDGTMHFKYVHSKEYQQVQFEFMDVVNSFNGEHLHKLLVENQLNVDALITYSDFCKISEEVVMAREYIERGLYVLERFFHPLFSLTTGKCRLDYKYPENRSLFVCLFKHIHFVSRRGCNRTALEATKVLFSLDSKDDPLGAILLLDQFALNCGEYKFISQSMVEWGANRNLEQLPNWAFSYALAEFHLNNSEKKSDDCSKADELIQDAILRFPMVLTKLLEKCSVQPDEKVTNCSYLNYLAKESTSQGLELLCHLYVERCYTSWKDSVVLAWLEKNVNHVVEIITNNQDDRIKKYTKQRRRKYQKAPLNVHRHAIMSELPGVTSLIPIEIRSLSTFGHDPLPPPNTVVTYERAQSSRETGPGRRRNPLGLFLNSMLPDFDLEADAQENPLQRNQDQIRAGVRQLMQAMRDLLVIPYVDPDEEPEEDVPFNDWE